MEQPKSKIALISHSLGKGGAERFAAGLSFLLTDLGHEIHHLIIEDAVDYDYAGSLYNLGEICSNDNAFQRKINKGILLKKYLEQHQIDVVIDNRSRNNFIREWFAQRIYGNRKRICLVHSFKLDEYFPSSPMLAKILYSDAEKIVCVSQAIEAEIHRKYKLRNTVTIYNSIDFSKLKAENKPNEFGNYVLYFGRLDEKVKNFSLMLEAFSLSKIYESGFKLLIMGDGPDSDFIKTEIAKWNLAQHIQLIPFQNNPYAVVGQAKFTLLTSRHEGFPMMLIESLALGVPVVSVDCQSGPKEIIQNGQNGLLVPNHDAHVLAQAIHKLATDSNLYDICKQNAATSVAHLSVENISRQWQQILTQP
ncbi:glycosyltransferase [Flavobacterium sp.]|uniref:glycosyltransferase n=1 Tax=Flavobacterium sp. TaxID=239 RepID=UPI0039E4863E